MRELRSRVQQELALKRELGEEAGSRSSTAHPNPSKPELESMPKFDRRATIGKDLTTFPTTLRGYLDLHDEDFVRSLAELQEVFSTDPLAAW